MRIMTFNILTDKRSEYPWDTRKEQVLSVVKNANPDVLCIQEASQVQKEWMTLRLCDDQAYGVGRNDGSTDGEQVVIFHKCTSLNQIGCGVFWLSETPDTIGSIGWDAKRPRTVTWKLLEDKYSQRFCVFNTHYDHIGKVANQNSAAVIQEKLRTISLGVPVILCGDFNSPEGSPAYQKIIDIGFADTRTAAATIQGASFTYHMFKMDDYSDEATKKELTDKHDRVFKRIDHIFISGAFAVQHNGTISGTHSNVYPSDHFPVVCDLLINPRMEQQRKN